MRLSVLICLNIYYRLLMLKKKLLEVCCLRRQPRRNHLLERWAFMLFLTSRWKVSIVIEKINFEKNVGVVRGIRWEQFNWLLPVLYFLVLNSCLWCGVSLYSARVFFSISYYESQQIFHIWRQYKTNLILSVYIYSFLFLYSVFDVTTGDSSWSGTSGRGR